MNKEQKYEVLILVQLVTVFAAVFGSLFFSEVLKFPPCDLCWYQRICIYPMSLILLTGIYLKSQDTVFYLLPFSIIGLCISLYHNLIYYKIIPVIVPCSETSPCTAEQLNWLGFVTIPLLSLLGFVALLILNLLTLILIRKGNSDEK